MADAPPNIDRLPPHSEEAESTVLGCILQSPDCVNDCMERFKGKTEAFYDLRHQTIWNVIKEMHERNEAIDVLTVQTRLRDRGTLEEVGGLASLCQLPDRVPSVANLPVYIDILLEKFLRRRMLTLCTRFAAQAFDNPDAAKLLDAFDQEVSVLTETQSAATEEHIKVALDRVLQDMEQHYKRGSTQLRGLPTGPNGNYLDKIIRGIREKYYMVVAGRPASGKTSWAMNLVEYLACDHVWNEPTGQQIRNAEGVEVPETRERKGIPIAVFSIEMDAESLGYRLVFGRAGVDSAQWSQGFASQQDEQNIIRATGHLCRSQIYIDATPAQTMGQIAAKARRMAKQYGIKLFVLDYLQLVEQEGGNGMDRVKELTKISRKIMALKKQLAVPWLVLAQMNRNIETTEVKRIPVMSDLKDCGAIEQDADLIMFLYKPDRKELERAPKDKHGNPTGLSDKELLDQMYDGVEWSRQPYRVDAFVAKNRFGPTGVAKLLFQKNLCRFADWHLEKVRLGAEDMKQGERTRTLGVVQDDDI